MYKSWHPELVPRKTYSEMSESMCSGHKFFLKRTYKKRFVHKFRRYVIRPSKRMHHAKYNMKKIQNLTTIKEMKFFAINSSFTNGNKCEII